MTESNKEPTYPELVLDRYLAGDLPKAKTREIHEAEKSSNTLRERLEKMRAERAAFAQQNPAELFAAQVSAKLAQDSDGATFTWSTWRWALPSVAAVAFGLFMMVKIPQEEMAEISRPRPASLRSTAPAPEPAELSFRRVEAQPPSDQVALEPVATQRALKQKTIAGKERNIGGSPPVPAPRPASP